MPTPTAAPPSDSPWIDLVDPDAARAREVEARCGIPIPSLAALEEIETTSRLRREGDALVMSAPLITHCGQKDSEHRWEIAPTGFILTDSVLVTVHYQPLAAFETLPGGNGDVLEPTPSAAFARLLETVVDHAADQLEALGETVGSVSRTIFFTDLERRGLDKETQILRRSIIKLGRASDRISQVRAMFLGVGRMANFARDQLKDTLDDKVRRRLKGIGEDIASLDEFEISLSGRIQFLLDAATSLISIKQNDVVKVLTIASVVGIPPVMVVGVYGMNFRYMPELGWPLGYPMAIALCVVSAILPYLWFKWRNWV